MAKSQPDLLYIGVGGHAVAIDPSTGTELWRTKLKASTFVTIYRAGSGLFAGAGGELFRLDPASGDVLWSNKLKGLGMGLVAFTSSDEVASFAALQAQRAAVAAAT
ncbi:MAG TPA: PQQ-binding-like beta-propeller repeat protein [Thermoanaerobaculaceae bacterium]|nr:PQQ-binding-like beta-propeller repeat protein [Thermoanaerobaculaceae bacterium]HPS78057.1 PQQ-binding-like beta-propeller repeat protein [Thermoanaerobaculaceae bacterium]